MTFRYWQFALYAVLAALTMALAEGVWPALGEFKAWPLLLGLLVVLGGYVAFITGMLYKIVPFLLWFDLQNRSAIGQPPPAMNRLLAEVEAEYQLYLFYLAGGGLLAAWIWPAAMVIPAGVLIVLTGAGLFLNLVRACWRYRGFRLQAVVNGERA